LALKGELGASGSEPGPTTHNGVPFIFSTMSGAVMGIAGAAAIAFAANGLSLSTS